MDLTATEAARLLASRRKALAGGEDLLAWVPGGAPGGARPEAPRDLLDPEALREIREIDAALARIADGTYGTCEVCGGAIGRDRLRALPEVRRCVGCSG